MPGTATNKVHQPSSVSTDNSISNPGAPKSGPGFCVESRHLLDAFGEAVRELFMLHEQQFQATVNGDPNLSRFDPLIQAASDKKSNAKDTYLRHLETHGCSVSMDLLRSSIHSKT
jgi:hypothetical protein